jgi:predicted nucleotidyltransferase
MCYMAAIEEQLHDAARRADAMRDESRRMLVESVRAGHAAGLSQRQIADAIGRSQPEVSRLLRFHGRTALARALEHRRRDVLARLTRAGAHDVRVFGSVSRGDDGPGSDVDLLVDFTVPPSLFELAELEADLSNIVGADVDVVPARTLRANLAPKALAEAVPL